MPPFVPEKCQCDHCKGLLQSRILYYAEKKKYEMSGQSIMVSLKTKPPTEPTKCECDHCKEIIQLNITKKYNYHYQSLKIRIEELMNDTYIRGSSKHHFATRELKKLQNMLKHLENTGKLEPLLFL